MEEARRKLEKVEGLLKSENAVKIRCPWRRKVLSLLKVRCLFRLIECLSLGPCPDRENGQSDYVDVFKKTQEELRVLSGIDAGIDAAPIITPPTLPTTPTTGS